MKKHYVSLETAKLLKEKGFKESCFGRYTTLPSLYKKGISNYSHKVDEEAWSFNSYDNNPHVLDAPELHEAQQWLRENKNIEVDCFIMKHSYEYQIVDILNKKLLYKSIHLNEEEASFDYAKIFQEAIIEALKMI